MISLIRPCPVLESIKSWLYTRPLPQGWSYYRKEYFDNNVDILNPSDERMLRIFLQRDRICFYQCYPPMVLNTFEYTNPEFLDDLYDHIVKRILVIGEENC